MLSLCVGSSSNFSYFGVCAPYLRRQGPFFPVENVRTMFMRTYDGRHKLKLDTCVSNELWTLSNTHGIYCSPPYIFRPLSYLFSLYCMRNSKLLDYFVFLVFSCKIVFIGQMERFISCAHVYIIMMTMHGIFPYQYFSLPCHIIFQCVIVKAWSANKHDARCAMRILLEMLTNSQFIRYVGLIHNNRQKKSHFIFP